MRMLYLGRFAAALCVASALSCTETVSPEANPLPALLSLRPTMVVVGSGDTALTVIGENFVRSSRVRFDGTDRATVFVNDSTLRVPLPAEAIDSAKQFEVTVVSPGPGGGTSGARSFVVGYDPPIVTSFTPTGVLRGAAPPLISITGTGFHPSSRLQWMYTTWHPTYVSPTQLTFTLDPAHTVSAGVVSMRVVNPNGTQSAAMDFEVRNIAPVITSLTPDSVLRGSPSTMVVLRGQHFVSGTTVSVNGVARAVGVMDSTTIQMSVTPTDAATLGTLQVRAINPGPGGGPSSPLPVRVVIPPPTILRVEPSSAEVGALGQLLTVVGADILADAIITIDGADRPTTVVNAGTATTMLTDADFASARALAVALRIPSRSTTSNIAAVTVLPPSLGLDAPLVVELRNNHIIADPVRPVLYASVPSSVATYGNRVAKIDVATGAIVASVAVGSEPNRMAISADGQFLYVGLNGAESVSRVRLSDFVKDLDIPLPAGSSCGSRRVEDIEVIPGSSTLVAMSLRNAGCSPRHEGVFLFSGATRLPVSTPGHTGSNRIAVGSRPDLLYGYNNESTEFGLRRISVSADGLRDVEVVGGVVPGFGVDIEHSGTSIWATTGRVVNESSLASVGTLPSGGVIRPDVPRGRVHVLVSETLQTYHYETFTLIGSAPIVDANEHNTMVRFGVDGLAVGGGVRIILVRGSLIGP